LNEEGCLGVFREVNGKSVLVGFGEVRSAAVDKAVVGKLHSGRGTVPEDLVWLAGS